LIQLAWLSPQQDALQGHLRAQEILQQLVATHPSDILYQGWLSSTYTNLALVHYSAGQAEVAEPLFEQALARYQRLAAANPSVTSLRLGVAIGQENLGCLRHQTGDFIVARDLFKNAISITKQSVVENPKAMTYQAKLINMYISLGDLERDAGNLEASMRAYQAAHEIASTLVTADPSARHRGILADTLRCLGQIQLDQGDHAAAQRLFQQDIDLRLVVNGADPRTPLPQPTDSYLGMGNLHRDLGQWNAAERSYHQAIAIWMRSQESSAEDSSAQDGLARAHLEMGRMKHLSGDRFAAGRDYELALAYREKLFSNSPSLFNHTRQLALNYTVLGDLRHDEGHSEEARGWYRKAVKTYRAFLTRKPDNAVVCADLAWLLATCPDPEIRQPAEARKLAQAAVDQSPRGRQFMRTLGVAQYRSGDWDGAIKTLAQAMKHGRGGDAREWLILAMAHCRLGHQEETRTWYLQAIDWMEKNRSRDHELRHLRVEAGALMSKPVPVTSPSLKKDLRNPLKG
jgi:tetratricopeptide (TPR) repeat protein